MADNITIPQNVGPGAGETLVQIQNRAMQYADRSVAPGVSIFDPNGTVLDADLMNLMALAIIGDDDENDYDQTINGVTNTGISPGFR